MSYNFYKADYIYSVDEHDGTSGPINYHKESDMAGVIQPKNREHGSSNVPSDPNQELVPLKDRATRGSLTMA